MTIYRARGVAAGPHRFPLGRVPGRQQLRIIPEPPPVVPVQHPHQLHQLRQHGLQLGQGVHMTQLRRSGHVADYIELRQHPAQIVQQGRGHPGPTIAAFWLVATVTMPGLGRYRAHVDEVPQQLEVHHLPDLVAAALRPFSAPTSSTCVPAIASARARRSSSSPSVFTYPASSEG